MKYMIMTFGSAEEGVKAMGRDWMLEMVAFMQALDKDLRESGELVDDHGLADGSQAKTVRFENGIPVPTDGPFAESKESLVGYWIVDVYSEERAIEIASRIVAFIKAAIEVRRVMDAPPDFCPCRAISRPCCASWRRRSSAPLCGGRGSSTPARMRFRKPCLRRPGSGRRMARRTTLGRGC